jgi:hypothetical protein
MKYDLHSPCGNCPFRTDCLPGWLRRGAAIRIIDSLFGHESGPFPCHKTLLYQDVQEYTDDGVGSGEGPVRTENTRHCAGALILMRKIGQDSECVQLAERLGPILGETLYEPHLLNLDAPVFNSIQEFLDHHTRADDPREQADLHPMGLRRDVSARATFQQNDLQGDPSCAPIA